MTAYLPNLGGSDDGIHRHTSAASESSDSGGARQHEHAHVDSGMVNAAVENVIRGQGIPLERAESYKRLMATNVHSSVAQNMYTTQAAIARARMIGVARKDITIPYSLREDQVHVLEQYATEYRLKFAENQNHDHPMAAAMRLIDNRVIRSRLPYGVSLTDVGGNPMTYVRAGDETVHVCGPVFDGKDPTRHRLRMMEAERLVERTDSNTAQYRLASRYIMAEPTFVCSRIAQACDHHTPVLTAIHVYDVPMADWPLIMERKCASLVEGCLLFSTQFYEQRRGELSASQVRYEIDVEKNEFRMGFKNSPSWWYAHKFDQYLLYGCDQLMVRSGYTYSYKVIERRADTVFFRIVRLPRSVGLAPRVTSWKRPGVRMVHVKGFELNPDSRGSPLLSLKPKDYWYPEKLWNDLTSEAMSDFEKGVMQTTKLFSTYRSVAALLTINGVPVAGSQHVGPDDLVSLIVNASIAAAATSLLDRRTTRAINDAEMQHRRRMTETTSMKVCSALGNLCMTGLCAPLIPFRALSKVLKAYTEPTFRQWLLEWAPVTEVVVMDVEPMLVSVEPKPRQSSTDVYRSASSLTAPMDLISAALVEPKLAATIRKMFPHVEIPAETKAEPAPTAAGTGTTAAGSTAPSVAKSEAAGRAAPAHAYSDDMRTKVAWRRAAILEHIAEAELVSKTLAATCEHGYKVVSLKGEPVVDNLRRNAEILKDPDMWLVVNGVVTRSALNVPLERFNYMAVYHPTRDVESESTIRTVYPQEYDTAARGRGGGETRTTYMLADINFTGWVYVADTLRIYNGPDIVRAMKHSVDMPHDYEIEVHEGPPGCGKTHMIIQALKDDQTEMVLCPVRQSIDDTRARVALKKPDMQNLKALLRSLDSFLANFFRDKRISQFTIKTAHIDECYMAHAGKICAVAGLLGVKKIHAYGDKLQIPHIPRVQAAALHVQLQADVTSHTWLTYRCPHTSVAAWGHLFDHKVRSNSQKRGSMRHIMTLNGFELPEDCMVLSAYQADKMMLQRKYSKTIQHTTVKEFVLTAHESQGKTYKNVLLVRNDPRRAGPGDRSSLFMSEPHMLVAMSRHTDGFWYCSPSDLDDLPSQWIKRASNPRRVNAAADTQSAGNSMEFI